MRLKALCLRIQVCLHDKAVGHDKLAGLVWLLKGSEGGHDGVDACFAQAMRWGIAVCIDSDTTKSDDA